MKVYVSMSSEEFIWQLRTSLIRSGAAPLVIDQVDQLCGLDHESEALEKLATENSDLEDKVAELEEQIEELKQELERYTLARR